MGDAARDQRTELPVYRISVAKYHAMRDAGIFDEDDQLELIEGVLVPKMTKNPPHRLATGLLREALERLAPEGCYVDSQEPITTARSEPEPDIVVVRGARRDYADRHPGPQDLLLVVEVADESLERDRGEKLRAYASAGVVAYWIVNLRERVVEAHGAPAEGRYADRRVWKSGEAVPVELDGSLAGSIPVDAILP